MTCPERHTKGQAVKGGFGWQGVCPCGWRGPWRAHPLDTGADLLDHQLDKAVTLR